ncbi:MAG: DUF748 domain-containing protein [Nitrospira sp.]|nr:DUF748 domain-containing protein [Nitrospira sp.]
MESTEVSKDDRLRHGERSLEKIFISISGFLFGLVGLLSLILVILPHTLRGWAESRLTSVFVHKVEIERLDLNVLTGHIGVDGFRIRSNEDGPDLILVQQITADVDLFALVDRQLSLTRLKIIAPVVHLVRSEAAVWNLPAIDERGSSSNSGTGISIIIHNAVLRDGSLSIEDRSVSPTRSETANDIQLTLRDVSPGSSAPAKLQGSASLSDSGTIAIDGVVIPNLRSGNLDIELTNISLASLQGALSDHLHMQGRVTARLAVTWPGTEQSLVGISGTLKGQDLAFSSAGFRLGQATSVTASSVEISWPDRVAVDRLLVSNPEVWVRRNETGHVVGFQSGGSSSRKPTTGSMQRNKQSDDATSSPQWRIDKIVVQEGTVHLEDASVSPAYSDVLRNLEMTLDDIMPIPEHAMIIHARADIASGGALDLRGQAALFGSTPNASLKAAIHRFVVPSTNSYLKRAVSHYTTEGTLTTLMNIRLRGDRLEVLSDVTLSDLEVEPIQNVTHRTVQERIGLPLSLLLTLLKDETGRIHITFPISGPLSNPTFDWTNAIWTTLRNVVMKLITLPIRSIGRFIMGSDDVDTLVIDPITFAPGSTTIRPDMDRTLHDLARLLRTETQTVLHLTPILSSTDLEALEHMPSESWPVPELDTAETARHVLAVRRAFMVSARLAGMGNVPSGRLPVNPPRRDTSDLDRPRVELELEKGDGASAMGLASSGSER